MAIDKIVRVICDRCKKVIEEGNGNATPSEGRSHILYLEHNGNSHTLTDLCGKCEARVTALVGQLNLDTEEEEPTKKQKPAKKAKEKGSDEG